MSDHDKDSKNTTPPPDPDQPDNVVNLPVRIEYDVPQLREFVQTVFHARRDGEHVMGWAVKPKTSPSLPYTIEHLLDTVLTRSSAPKALYFGTSTTHADEEHQRPLNRASLFDRLHVVVLDDIGTKVPIARLPEDLKIAPSYIIETSEDNFQYGYVLEEPIDNLEQAKALIQLIYDSGFSDGGGAMPTKLVRLPDGVNGKAGREDFPVTLQHLSNQRWTPEALLRACKCGVTWESVVKDARGALRSVHARSVTPWSPVELQSPNLDGDVDPVLEWLYTENRVIQETGNWVNIHCPWALDHTNGNPMAGYSPLGRGDGTFTQTRGFKCFHEHCRDRKSETFLAWVAENGGPEAAQKEIYTELSKNWAYDPTDDLAWQIRGESFAPGPIKLANLRNALRKRVFVHASDGKVKTRSVVDVWLDAPHRLTVAGANYDPTTDSPLSVYDGHLYVNRFKRTNWGKHEIYDDDIETFLEFLTYLIPDETERGFFLDWLAAKVQNLAFRGPAILMVTPAYGTGRSTLGDMISVLVGRSNTVSLPFERILSGDRFNEWMTRPLIITNETSDFRDRREFYRAYERLKGLVDFRSEIVLIEEKYRVGRYLPIYTSYVMFSNHVGALHLPESDRRVYVITNPVHVRDPDYYVKLHEWLRDMDEETGQPAWARSVYHWLCERTPDMNRLMRPVETTEGKQRMLEQAASPIEIAVQLILKNWNGPLIAVPVVTDIIGGLAVKLGISHQTHLNRVVQNVMNQYTIAPGTGAGARRFRINGKRMRGRIRIDIGSEELKAAIEWYETASESELTAAVLDNDPARIKEAVEDDLANYEL